MKKIYKIPTKSVKGIKDSINDFVRDIQTNFFEELRIFLEFLDSPMENIMVIPMVIYM
jgi:hypothetical protein